MTELVITIGILGIGYLLTTTAKSASEAVAEKEEEEETTSKQSGENNIYTTNEYQQVQNSVQKLANNRFQESIRNNSGIIPAHYNSIQYNPKPHVRKQTQNVNPESSLVARNELFTGTMATQYKPKREVESFADISQDSGRAFGNPSVNFRPRYASGVSQKLDGVKPFQEIRERAFDPLVSERPAEYSITELRSQANQRYALEGRTGPPVKDSQRGVLGDVHKSNRMAFFEQGPSDYSVAGGTRHHYPIRRDHEFTGQLKNDRVLVEDRVAGAGLPNQINQSTHPTYEFITAGAE